LRLVAADGKPSGKWSFEELNDKSLRLSDGDQPVMVYNHGVITSPDVPESDHRRSRGCYIHPLWGLNGEVLTDDFSKDHYHHHGVFWTWPHIGIGDDHYDMWSGNNIEDRLVRFLHRQAGPAAAVLGVENGWYVGEKKVMIERVWMRTHAVSGDTRALDLEFTWVPTDRPVTLWGAGGKSYGGLTVRYAVRDQKETIITVPEGRTSGDLAIASLPWADLTNKFGDTDDLSGAAIFVHPEHPDYPPTWLTRHYGPLCIGWPGIKPQTLPPGKPIRLSYRILIHKTELDAEQLQQAYDGYAAACKAKLDRE